MCLVGHSACAAQLGMMFSMRIETDEGTGGCGLCLQEGMGMMGIFRYGSGRIRLT